MEVLGIGLPELFFIVLLILVLINPKDMQKTGLMLGRWLNRLVHSSFWKTITGIQHVPSQLMREANLADLDKELNSIVNPNMTGRISVPNGNPAPRRPAHNNVERASLGDVPPPAEPQAASPDPEP